MKSYKAWVHQRNLKTLNLSLLSLTRIVSPPRKLTFYKSKILQSIWEVMRSVNSRCSREWHPQPTDRLKEAVSLASHRLRTSNSESETSAWSHPTLAMERKLRKQPWLTKPWTTSLSLRLSLSKPVAPLKVLLNPTYKDLSTSLLALDLTSTTSHPLSASRAWELLKCCQENVKEVSTLTLLTCSRLK